MQFLETLLENIYRFRLLLQSGCSCLKYWVKCFASLLIEATFCLSIHTWADTCIHIDLMPLLN